MIKFLKLIDPQVDSPITLYDMYVVTDESGVYGYFETKSFFIVNDEYLEDLLFNNVIHFELHDNDHVLLKDFKALVYTITSNYLQHHDRYYFANRDDFDMKQFIRDCELKRGMLNGSK
jgi:hypothetical protein